jgi:hypothetical protein
VVYIGNAIRQQLHSLNAVVRHGYEKSGDSIHVTPVSTCAELKRLYSNIRSLEPGRRRELRLLSGETQRPPSAAQPRVAVRFVLRRGGHEVVGTNRSGVMQRREAISVERIRTSALRQ